MPTVVPSKPLLVGGVKTPGSKSTSSPGAKLPAVVEGKKGSREIDPPPPQTEKVAITANNGHVGDEHFVHCSALLRR